MTEGRWLSAIAFVAAAKVTIAGLGLVVGFPVTTAGGASPREVIFAAMVVVFSVTAIFLVVGGAKDRRAWSLALCFLLVATTFGDPLLERLALRWPEFTTSSQWAVRVQIAAFMPYALWRFVAEFPRVSRIERGAGAIAVAKPATLVLASVLLTANLIQPFTTGTWGEFAVDAFSRLERGALFWPTVFVFMVPAVPFAVWRAPFADRDERRRVRLLLGAIVMGSTPIFVLVLAMATAPAVALFIRRPTPFLVAQSVVYAALLSLPILTAYAVLVHRALDVRLVVRKAVQYGFARYTTLTAAAVPFAALALLLYWRRDVPVGQLLSGSGGAFLLLAGVAGLLAVKWRTKATASIDRYFFREQYDAQKILGDLVQGSRRVIDRDGLERLLTTEIDRALHLESLSFLSVVRESGVLITRSNKLRPLSLDSELTGLVQRTDGPLEVDWSSEGVGALPEPDRHWLVDAGARLLVRLSSASGDLIGLVALGDKKSELPYTREDRRLLTTVAAAASATLEDRILRQPSAREVSGPQIMALVCQGCGKVWPEPTDRCGDCQSTLKAANIPIVVGGKFRLEREVGAGGMGVVYRALDLELRRPVAIKTLPVMQPLLALRLRREARAAAAVSHANLALIYGSESWQGVPMLVFEYLDGGTLAERIEDGPFPVGDALELGMMLCDAVEQAHRVGILHRDIKPSNVGFTGQGIPKLLDFGLARVHEASQPLRINAVPTDQGLLDGSVAMDDTDGALVGTVPYLSPEAVMGHKPDPSFDLWAICLLLYEAVSGANPLRDKTIALTFVRITKGQVPDVRDSVPGCPAAVADFFHEALASDRERRPKTAKALCRRLVNLRQRID